MSSSTNSPLHRRFEALGDRHDPGFAVIVAFDFYDGPERGLAVYSSGEGVRFLSLGDSRSRFFRAFELTRITGDWWQQVHLLPGASTIEPTSPASRVWLPSASEALTMLENNVLGAVAIGYSVAVGSPYLKWLMTCPVTAAQAEALRQLDGSPEAFRSVHQMVKHHSRGPA